MNYSNNNTQANWVLKIAHDFLNAKIVNRDFLIKINPKTTNSYYQIETLVNQAFSQGQALMLSPYLLSKFLSAGANINQISNLLTTLDEVKQYYQQLPANRHKGYYQKLSTLFSEINRNAKITCQIAIDRFSSLIKPSASSHNNNKIEINV